MVTLGASLGPEFETTIVYCCELPVSAGEGARVLVMLRSKRAAADWTLAVAVSLAGIESSGEETVAVEESVVPLATVEGTCDTTVNVAEVDAFIVEVSEQDTVPLVPTAGGLHDHPEGVAIETNVVGGGSGRVTEALMPVLGP